MTITPTTTAPAGPTIGEQAPTLLGHVAGYAAHRTVAIGLRQGLVGDLWLGKLGGGHDGLLAVLVCGRGDVRAGLESPWATGSCVSSVRCTEIVPVVRVSPGMINPWPDRARSHRSGPGRG